jgi:hypothetical protein
VKLALTVALVVLPATVLVHPSGQGRTSAPAATPTTFAALVQKLSEPGGDFGGDNLISNEQSYLRVLPALARAGVTGGAYVGVGPDQNFSYIAQVKPSVAFLIDIRRDNLLLHLLFKAIFAAAPTRVEYLCLLTGRAPPVTPAIWSDAGIDKIIGYVDAARLQPPAGLQALRTRLDGSVKSTNVPLSAADLERIGEFHRAFIDAGLSLVFQARGRAPAPYYPSFRTLLGEHDGAGHQLSFLASEPAYQFLRGLQSRDLIVPVVGDVSGPRAMRAIATEMTSRGTPLSAFYISNVEYYIFMDGRFPAFVENLKRFPHNERSTMVRSVFPGGFRGVLPQSTPESYSTSITQPLNGMLADLAAGKYRSYADLVLASSR